MQSKNPKDALLVELGQINADLRGISPKVSTYAKLVARREVVVAKLNTLRKVREPAIV